MIPKPKKSLYLILLLLLAYGCKGKEVVGTPAVDFVLEGINGGQIPYSGLRGRPVLLYFFASW